MRVGVALILASLVSRFNQPALGTAPTAVESQRNATAALASVSRQRGSGRHLLRKRLISNNDADDDARGNGTLFVPPPRAGFTGSTGGQPRNWRRAAQGGPTVSSGATNASVDDRSSGLASLTTQISDALSLQKHGAPATPMVSAAQKDGSKSSGTPPYTTGVAGASLRRVARRQAPLDGGATQVYVPTARERGDFHLDTTMGCAGWRETAGCSPHGPRLSFRAAPCDHDVTSEKSGYCECTVGGGGGSTRSSSSSDDGNRGGVVVRAGHVGCGHLPFRCRDVCRRPPRRLCRGFVAMDSCTPLAPGENTGTKAAGWDFLSSKATTCHVTAHTAPLGIVPDCWAWQPMANQRCDAVLDSQVAGYCECGAALLKPDAPGGGGLWRVRVDCGHPPVSCAYLCNAEAEASPHGGDYTASSGSGSGGSRGFDSSGTTSTSSDPSSSARWRSGILPPSAVGSYAVAGHGARHPLLAHLPHGVTAHEALGGGEGRSSSGSMESSAPAASRLAGASLLSAQGSTYSHSGLSLLPAAHVPWAWHTKAGLWHSSGSDWVVAPLLNAVASRHRAQQVRSARSSSSETPTEVDAGPGGGGGHAKMSVLGPIAAYEAHVASVVAHPPCREASRHGRYSGAIGCIGTRPKWTLALPLTPALRKAAASFTSPEALSVPWLVGRGVYSSATSRSTRSTTTTSLLNSDLFSNPQPNEAEGEKQGSNSLFDVLPSCARLASVGDCSKIAPHCTVSCAALFLRLQPSPELCFPHQFKNHFKRSTPLSSSSSPSSSSTDRTAPFRAAAAASTVLLADDALRAKQVRISWNVRRRKLASRTSNKSSKSDFGPSSSRPRALNASVREHLETVVDAGDDPVQDYLRGVKRASTMRVVLLALCLHPEATGNAPLSYHGASGWAQRLTLLKESVGRFKDYRILVQAHDQPPEGSTGLNKACSEHRRVHCHHQTFHLSSSSRKRAASQPPVATKATNVNKKKGDKGPKQRGYYQARNRRHLLGKSAIKDENTVRYPYGSRGSKREVRKAKQQSAAPGSSSGGTGGSTHGDVTGVADASATAIAIASGGGGEISISSSAANAMFSARAYAAGVSEARLTGAELAHAKRSLLEMWRHAEGGALLKWELVIMVDLGALGTPLPGVGAGTAALHASGYHQVDVLGFDPTMVFRAVGRVAPLDGFDVLCGLSSHHLHAFKGHRAPKNHDNNGKNSKKHQSRFGTARAAAENAFAQTFGLRGNAEGPDVGDQELLEEEDDSDGRPGYGMHSCATLPAPPLMDDDEDEGSEDKNNNDNPTHESNLRPRPYPVRSCFSGIALYNPQALLACDYPEPDSTFLAAASPAAMVQSVTRVEKDIPDLLNIGKDRSSSSGSGSMWNEDDDISGGGHDRCDHEHFHRCLRGSGFTRAFVDPTLVAYAAPASVSALEAHRKVRPAVQPLDRACVQLDDPSGAAYPPSF